MGNSKREFRSALVGHMGEEGNEWKADGKMMEGKKLMEGN